MKLHRLLTALLVMTVSTSSALGASAALGVAGVTSSDDGTHLVYEGDTVALESAPGQVVRGESDLSAGTNLSVVVESTGERRFLKTDSATVDQSGEFRASFDLSGVPVGTPLVVRVYRDGDPLATANGSVVDCTDDCATTDTTTEAVETTRNEYDELAFVETTQGEVAHLPVAVGGDDTARLTVGGRNTTYSLTVEVHDGNGDGGVTVRFDTGAIGRDRHVVRAANDSDAVSVTDEQLSSDRSVLDEGEYPMEVSGGLPGEGRDLGVLVVRDTPMDEPGTTGTWSDVSYLVAIPVDSHGDDKGQYAVPNRSVDRLNRSVVTDFGLRDSFERDPFETAPNGTARIELRTDEIRTATVVIGNDSDSYTLSAVVSDGTGDERVVLLFNQTAAVRNGTAPTLTTADDGDEVSVTLERGTPSGDRYGIAAYLGSVDPDAALADGPLNARLFGTSAIRVTDTTARLAVSTETPATSTDDGFPTVVAGAFGLAAVLAVLGVVFLTGIVDL